MSISQLLKILQLNILIDMTQKILLIITAKYLLVIYDSKFNKHCELFI